MGIACVNSAASYCIASRKRQPFKQNYANSTVLNLLCLLILQCIACYFLSFIWKQYVISSEFVVSTTTPTKTNICMDSVRWTYSLRFQQVKQFKKALRFNHIIQFNLPSKVIWSEQTCITLSEEHLQENSHVVFYLTIRKNNHFFLYMLPATICQKRKFTTQ